MHAYLIIAHKYDIIFETLISLLDDPRNDIFIHIDKKCKNFPFDKALRITKDSKITFTKRISTTWGSATLIWAELILLRAAAADKQYDYYHLLSGEDLPIKHQDEIHAFFDKNNKKEFVNFNFAVFPHSSRVYYYHIGQNICGKNKKDWTRRKDIAKHIKKNLVQLQKKMHKKFNMHRNKGIDFRSGSQWFSITDKLARYVLDNEKWIRKTFRYTYCADEIFLQTLVHNSPFKDLLYRKEYGNNNSSIMRYIIWEKDPHVFIDQDKELLFNSKMLFARKFQAGISDDIAKEICQNIQSRKGCCSFE